MNKTMKNIKSLKTIESELKLRLEVLYTNSIDREKRLWENAIIKHKPALLDAYEFLISIPLNHKGLTQEQYLAHCLRVSTFGIQFAKMEPEKAGIIGLIHNIYEVTDVKEKDVIKHFGTEVSEGLSILKIDRSLQSDPNYLRQYYKNIADLNPYLMNVKVLDKLDNLFMLGLNPNDEVRDRYLEEIKEYIVPLAKKMDDDLAVYIEKLIVYNKNVGHFTKKIKL